MGDYLTVKEAAALMRMGIQTVYRLIWAGELKRINVARKGATKPSWRIRRSAVDAFMGAREKGRMA